VRRLRPTALVAAGALVLGVVEGVVPAVAAAAPAPATRAAAPVDSAPDQVSAALAARKQGHRVLVDGVGSPRSRTYANPNGSYTLESYPTAAFRRDGDKWVPLSGALTGAGTGSAPFTAAGLARPVTLGGTAATLMAIDVPGGAVTLSAPGLRVGPAARSGSTLTYGGAARDTDLQLAVGADGVKTNLVLRSAAAPHRFSFHLADPKHLLGRPARAPDGSWVFGADLGDGYHLAFAPATAYDPAATRAAKLSSPGVDRTSADQRLTPRGDGWDVTLSVTEKWLAGKAFPIVLDPSPTFITGIDQYDCHLVNADRANTSFCISATRDIGFDAGLVRRALMHFDVTTIPTTAVPSSADLDFDVTQLVDVTGTTFGLQAFRLTSNWTTAATWNSTGTANWSTPGGAFDGSVASVNSSVTASLGHHHLPVGPSIVQSWINRGSPDFGLLVKANDEGGTGVLRIASGQAADTSTRPRLTVTYNTPPTTPTALSVRPCASVCSPSALTSSATPTLAAQSTDADHDRVRYSYEVYAGHAATPPAAAVATGQVPDAASGALATWLPPALSTGDYEYRVKADDGALATAWSAFTPFTVDITAPSVPALSSTTFSTEGGWGTARAGTFTFASTDASGIAGYSWQLDRGGWSAYSTTASAALSALTDGLHTYRVRAQDKAGGVSDIATRHFGVLPGGIAAPVENTQTQARVTVTGVAPAGKDWLSWQFRVGSTAAFVPVAAENLTVAGTSTHPALPIGRDPASTATPKAFPCSGPSGTRGSAQP
jgi:hypothetical protein